MTAGQDSKAARDGELVELIDGVMVLDDGGRIVAFSEGAERITGYASSEVIGETCREVFRSNRCDSACPADKTIKSGIALSNCTCHIITRDDDEIEISLNTSPLKGTGGETVGVVVVFRNLNEMVEMMERLTELDHEMMREKERSEAILNSIADGVITVSRDLEIVSFNRSAEKVTGFSAAEVIGKPCRTIFRSRACEEGCPVLETIRTGEPVAGVEVEILARDGSRIPVSMNTALLKNERGEVSGAVETFRDLSNVRKLTEELRGRYSFRSIIGRSPEIQQVFELIRSAAPTNVTVLIQGETGTGKELVARAIHYESPRSDRRFVAVNCAALPATLLESELFGHVKGSFTGATFDRKGRFERADGGTIFLDEIAEIGYETQAKLLRVLENREFERVGDSATRKVDVRLICATNKNLRELVGAGKFREDLYYRINVVTIDLPPLRARSGDVPLLIDHFVDKLSKETGKAVTGISPDAMDLLIDYPWPGNVREMENAIGHAFVHCRGEALLPEHLPPDITRGIPHITHAALGPVSSVDQMEKLLIEEALKQTGGNRTRAARKLGMSRSSLWRKIKKHGLEV
ncbi:MAG: sigma 54-interacting transcriptional regulator [bacterium]|jgi:PAS domain S-box-containing protein